jgi:hypothetical protein
MATITPNAAMMMRLLPAIVIEGVGLIGSVLLYVLTEQLLWIFVAAAVGVIGALYILYIVFTNRSEWKWSDGTPGDKR